MENAENTPTFRDKLLANSHIVRDFTIGPTRILIADDCCRDKTPEDVQRILRKIARDAQAAISAAALAAE